MQVVQDEQLLQKAWRAAQVARKMHPQWQALVRMFARDPKITLKFSSQLSATDGKVVWLKVPIELGDDLEHVRHLCGKRDEHKVHRCEACRLREHVVIHLLHETAHLVFNTFEPIPEEQRAAVLEQAIRAVCKDDPDDRRAKKIEARWNDIGSRTNGGNYFQSSRAVSPFLPNIINAVEDVRVNAGMMRAREGTRTMLEALHYSDHSKGVQQGDGRIVHWKDYQPNLQAMISIYLIGSGMDVADWLDPDIAATLTGDREFMQLIDSIGTITSVRQSYQLGFALLDVLRRLGFCRDEEDELEGEPPPGCEDGKDEGDESDDSDDSEKGQGSSSPNNEEEQEDGDKAEQPGQPGSEGSEDESVQDSDSGDGSSDDNDGESSETAGNGSDNDQDSDPENDGSDAGTGADESSDDSGASESESDSSSSGEGSSEDAPGQDGGASDPGDQSGGDSGSGSSESDDLSGDSPEADSEGRDSAGSSGERDPSSGGEDSSPHSDSESTDSVDSEDTGGNGEGSGSPAGEPSEADDGTSDDPGAGASGDSSSGSEASGGTGELEPEGSESDDTSSESTEADDLDGPGSPASFDGGESDPDGPHPDTTPSDTSPQGGDKVDPSGPTGTGWQQRWADYGSAEETEEAFKEFSGHKEEEKSYEEQREEKMLEQVMEVALVQAEHFDHASHDLEGLVIHTWDKRMEPDPDDDDARFFRAEAWSDNRYYDVPQLIPPPTLIAPALNHLRLVFTDNRRGARVADLKKGRVNTRVLGRRVPAGDDRLFQRKLAPGKKSYGVVVGMDLSGSTAGPLGRGDSYQFRARGGDQCKLFLIKGAVYAKAEMLNRLGVDFCVYGHTGTYGVDMYEVKATREPWSDKTKERLAAIGPAGGNYDGHSLEFYRKQAERMTATHRVVLFYTDGALNNIGEEYEVFTENVQICQRQNITIVGVEIGTHSGISESLGLPTVRLDSIEDIDKVVKFLEKFMS